MNASPDAETLLRDALNLPFPERSHLASRLIESLDDDTEVNPSWRMEIARRVESVRNGSSRLSGHESVIEEARKILAEARSR